MILTITNEARPWPTSSKLELLAQPTAVVSFAERETPTIYPTTASKSNTATGQPIRANP
jgi:hypothetical protein